MSDFHCWLDPYIKQQAAHYGLTVDQHKALLDGACAFDEALTRGEVEEPPAKSIGFNDVLRRIVRLRAKRRQLGWFDHCSDSWDMRSTSARAWRVYQRIKGLREPLLHPDSERPIPGHSFHY